jgi:hypothetical protein
MKYNQNCNLRQYFFILSDILCITVLPFLKDAPSAMKKWFLRGVASLEGGQFRSILLFQCI